MQKNLKIHRVDPEENASQTYRQPDGPDEQEWFYRIPTTKLEILSFLEIQE